MGICNSDNDCQCVGVVVMRYARVPNWGTQIAPAFLQETSVIDLRVFFCLLGARTHGGSVPVWGERGDPIYDCNHY